MKSNLCDYNDAYILVTADITATAALATQVLLKRYYSLKVSQKLMEQQ